MANNNKNNGSKAKQANEKEDAQNTDPLIVTSTESPDAETETTPAPPAAGETPSTEKLSKLEKLKRASEASRQKAVTDSMSKLELFDSTKAAEWGTTGTYKLGSMKTEDNALTITGRNIGAEQREPDWTEEQLKVIDAAKKVVLPIMPVANTRRSVIDPNMEYIGRDDTGTIVPTEKAYASSLSVEEYCIGIGPNKYDKTGTPRYYADVVIADVGGNWLANQWTSEGVVIEGVSTNVLMQSNRPGNTSGRRIGQHFARIGLPAYAFGPLFNTISQRFDGCMSQVTSTRGYYWMNASWGVSSFSATFSYLDNDHKVQNTNSLADVMRMLNGKSSLCLGTVAISVTCGVKMVDGEPTPDTSSFGLSVKMHNAFSVDVVDYHGPPQQGSTGMTVPARIAMKARAMGKSLGPASGGSLGSIFGSKGGNIFGASGDAAPAVKQSSGKEYMV